MPDALPDATLPISRLGLAPPMAPIIVEAGDLGKTANSLNIFIRLTRIYSIQFVIILTKIT
jgi:hypothetical protein